MFSPPTLGARAGCAADQEINHSCQFHKWRDVSVRLVHKPKRIPVWTHVASAASFAHNANHASDHQLPRIFLQGTTKRLRPSLVNKRRIFQGSQKRHVRVAISQRVPVKIPWYQEHHFQGFSTPALWILDENTFAPLRQMWILYEMYQEWATSKFVLFFTPFCVRVWYWFTTPSQSLPSIWFRLAVHGLAILPGRIEARISTLP